MTNSEIQNDLEEAADNHIRKVVDAAGHPGWDWTTEDIADAFISRAKWQKEQMLKGAAEHYVIGVIAGSPVGPAIVHYDDNLNIGDKVKVIIVKED